MPLSIRECLATAPHRPACGLPRGEGHFPTREDLLTLPVAVPVELLADLVQALEALQEKRTAQGYWRSEDLDELLGHLHQALEADPLQAWALQLLLLAIPKAQDLGLAAPALPVYPMPFSAWRRHGAVHG